MLRRGYGDHELQHDRDKVEIFELGEDVLVLTGRDRLETDQEASPYRLTLRARHQPDQLLVATELLEEAEYIVRLPLIP